MQTVKTRSIVCMKKNREIKKFKHEVAMWSWHPKLIYPKNFERKKGNQRNLKFKQCKKGAIVRKKKNWKWELEMDTCNWQSEIDSAPKTFERRRGKWNSTFKQCKQHANICKENICKISTLGFQIDDSSCSRCRNAI